MSGGETAFFLGFMASIILLDLLATEGVGPFGWLWNGMARALREILYRLAHPGYSLSRRAEVPEREPDWWEAAQEVGFFDPLDLELAQVRAWTTEEREMFGVNDTDALIDRIDRELGQGEWREFVAGRTIPAAITTGNETTTARQIRRNGAQLFSGPPATYRVNGS